MTQQQSNPSFPASVGHAESLSDTSRRAPALAALGQRARKALVPFVLLTCSLPAFSTTSYTVVDLGTLAGGSTSLAEGINSSGNVAGSGLTSGDGTTHAVSWTAGSIQDLGTLGGGTSQANAINNSGLIAGSSGFPGASSHAFVSNGTALTDLSPTAWNAQGWGINSAGLVAGDLAPSHFAANHAVIWNGSTVQDLGTLGGYNSYGRAINDAGDVAGFSDINGPSAYHAFFWNGASEQDLGTLVAGSNVNSQGLGINDAGKVVGYSDVAGGFHHAFYWNGTAMLDLGTLGGDNSTARSINSAGLVVGQTGTGLADAAFLWDGAKMTDLNSLVVNGAGWQLQMATGINDANQITGYGVVGHGNIHAFLLTPVTAVPEPDSWALFSVGALALFLRQRNRQPRV